MNGEHGPEGRLKDRVVRASKGCKGYLLHHGLIRKPSHESLLFLLKLQLTHGHLQHSVQVIHTHTHAIVSSQ